MCSVACLRISPIAGAPSTTSTTWSPAVLTAYRRWLGLPAVPSGFHCSFAQTSAWPGSVVAVMVAVSAGMCPA
ncbi:hypothetical protein D3C83_19430 [compost metagenome]